MFTEEEKHLIIQAVNHGISYRLNNETRLSEIKTLKAIKEKLTKNN